MMRSIVSIELALLSLVLFATCPPAKPQSKLGVFVGTSPCAAVARRPLGIPAIADCEMIKWNLTFYQEPDTLAPTTYELNFTYGIGQPNTNGFKNGGTELARKGKWAIARGIKTDSSSLVYKLDAERSEESISFVKLDDNLIHLLDADRSLAVGTAGWSYTLSRTEPQRHPTNPPSVAGPSPAQTTPTTQSSSPGAAASSVLGRFAGRSPCVEVVREMNHTIEADCMKLKWDLTLYQDSRTFAPTTYTLRGTLYRDQIRKGTWKTLRGAGTNPGAVIYQLDSDASQGPLLFLKADDNILYFLDRSRNLLVGNYDFSYTLNRVRTLGPGLK